MSGKRSRSRNAVNSKFEAWINDPDKVMGWVCKHNLEKMLDKGGGLVKIPNFFPSFVADGILSVLESIPSQNWNVTEAERDHAKNNIAHKFWSVNPFRPPSSPLRQFARLFTLARALSLAGPRSLHLALMPSCAQFRFCSRAASTLSQQVSVGVAITTVVFVGR